VETLALDDVVVVQARAEDAGRDDALRGTFDLAVARALAPLAVLVEYALPLLREGGVLAAQKGSRADAEVMEARGALAALGGVVEIVAPLSLPQESVAQHVVMIRRAGPLDDRYPRRTGIPTKRPLR
jgi:16S rRNA (guanine527-N7)-methyltransferase